MRMPTTAPTMPYRPSPLMTSGEPFSGGTSTYSAQTTAPTAKKIYHRWRRSNRVASGEGRSMFA